jgi:AcrR family transcriptional regulator
MIELLWDPPAPATKGPRPKLTLAEVVGAGMAIAAEDGIDQLSMRNVARRLGVGAMSLYTYVPGRDELFELMVDRAYGTRRLADPGRPWREQLRFHAQQAWQMYSDFPWMVRADWWRTPMGPGVLTVQEDLYRACDLTGLPADDVVEVTRTLEGYVFGAARGRASDPRVAVGGDASDDEYWSSRASFWVTYYRAEAFPTMTKIWLTGAFDRNVEPTLDFGIDRFLDGVEALVAERGTA